MDNEAEPNLIDTALLMFVIWVCVSSYFKVVVFMIYCWGSWWLVFWSQLPCSAGLSMLCGAGFSLGQQGGSPGMAHGWTWKAGPGSPLEKSKLPSPGMFAQVLFLDVSLFPKNCSDPWPSGRLQFTGAGSEPVLTCACPLATSWRLCFGKVVSS